ncbi:hypothetical protein SCUCBS95973_001533 [Sporothrix curviconia]|uniref:Glyoxalase-like domain-containing protein n=1 Tax=Sporothrix curviconia TaxID=1260050 RepID=A0ABP0AZC4_9PEZI
MPPTLDHIVLLVPHNVLQALPAWLTDALTVTPGGQHAGGVTENQLVLFQDGVYIEIIAFVGGSGSDEEDHARRKSHRWGGQPDGHIIDWAIGLAGAVTPEDADKEFRQTQKAVGAAGAGLAYKDLVAGGRTTPDGVVLQWATASPAAVSGESDSPHEITGTLPFWCIDRTGRQLRVPYATRPELARHPSAAVGVASVTLHVADAGLLDRLRRVYAVLFGTSETDDEWVLAVPETPASGKLPRLRIAHSETGQKIELALFTTGPAQTVGGYFVEGWRVDIQLVHVDG